MIDFLQDFLSAADVDSTKIPAFLSELMEVLQADFLQLVFDPNGQGGFKNSVHTFKRYPPSQKFILHIKGAAQQYITGPEPLAIVPAAIQEDGAALNCPYGQVVAAPLHTAGALTGVLLAGFTQASALPLSAFKQAGADMKMLLMEFMLLQADKLSATRQAFLLSMSQELAAIQNRRQLLHLIDNRLKPLFKFSASTIFLLDTYNGVVSNFFFDAETNTQSYPFCQHINVGKLPIDDNIQQLATDMLHPVTFDFEELSETRVIGPYLRSERVLEQAGGLAFNLTLGSEVIGNWIFLFPGKQVLHEEQLNYLQYIANQVTAVILKIKSIEEIRQREKERETILSINVDLALTKDRKDLLRVLHHKLTGLFDFGHHFVAIINDDELTMTSFLQDTESVSKFHPRYKYNITAKFPINDQVFNKVLLSKDPMTFDLELLYSRGAMPDYMVINYESGVRKMVMVTLQVRTRIIGVWVICLLEGQHLNKYQLELIKSISHQLSIAVDNIKAIEANEAKDAEREFLLQISSDITTIRDRAGLFPLFNKTLRNRFGFEDAVLMVANDDDTYSLFACIPEKPGALEASYKAISGEKYAVRDGVFDKVINTSAVFVFNLDTLIQEGRMPAYLLKEYEHGVRKKIGVRLRKDNEVIGAVFFNGWKNGHYTDHELELINGISFQVSTAVANILANEEIIRRERERALLLSLSTDIAGVRNNNQLLQVITEQLKSLLNFSHILIGTLNEGGDTISAFLLDPDSKSKHHAAYQSAAVSSFSVNDGVINKVFSSAAPLSFDFDQLAEQQDLPVYFKINRESGINQAIAIRFSRDVFAFGILFMFFERKIVLSPGNASLISGLGHQISIAVSNILANQEIKHREEEKSKLLKFSNELAAERNVRLLSKTLKRQLRELFAVEDFFVTALSDDRHSHTAILYDADVATYKHPDFSKLAGQYADIYDGVCDVILNSDGPVLFNTADWWEMETPPVYAGLLREGDIKAMIGAVIKVGQEPIGFIFLQHDTLATINGHSQLFKSVCSQLAVTLSNILANQKVDSQLKQIERYKEQLEEEKTYLTEEIETIHNSEIIGESRAVRDTLKLISQVAPSDSTVLILGETGTGKELIARAVHNNSPRKQKLMVKVNCAALPANLIESELFGHERGSFTGATERRVGKFELANGGTLFLDEIGEMPLDLQVKLLRALQEKEIERIGGKGAIKVDVRFIAATNRNLEKEMEEGRFRSDLFYRLNIFPISLLPLRERRQDIELLAMHFVNRFAKKTGKAINSLSNKVMQELQDYNWPGNIRELEHLIERSVLLATGSTLKQVYLPAPRQREAAKAAVEEIALKTIDDNEKEHIYKILKYCKGKIAGEGGAAEILGVPPTTLNSKIKRLGIKREHSM